MIAASTTAIWLVVGLVAGLLDYAFAAGFGLVASMALSGVLGYDPRSVAGAAACAQIVSATPMLIMHHRVGNISNTTSTGHRDVRVFVVVFALSSTLSALALSSMVTRLPRNIVLLAYSSLLATLAPLLYYTATTSHASMVKRRRGGHVAMLLGALAGAYKALIGGGYSAVVVVAQRMMGIDLRSAIALTPLIKLPAFGVVALTYWLSGHIDPVATTVLTAGAVVSTPLAAHMLHRARAPVLIKLLAIMVSVVALARLARLVLAST